ncbi:Predicted spermidine synthase with an N-terminal membrane domain [Legionella lansingensis]|uniref:Spermidine synthase n=1 Tax=Legionella lansingensis TaxID=45067 RepID=A0A0W0VQX4_9GAMM|nr:hypothetical protein [Legionella lansingensis]KTD22102.1 Spermidine synthase [Legionella lansingensis]SNV45787.1 Predicted spermidine synthase with an N-terminal membrane domain [Legionella lansingensis]
MRKNNISIYLAVFLISFSTLLLEITLTKILSVTLWYHFSFLVISLAMFGIGFGGLLVYFLKEHFQCNISANLCALSLAMAISIPLNLHTTLSYSLPNSLSIIEILRMLWVYLICTAPFVLSSMIFSILFLNWTEKASLIYGADLQGAAIGCFGCIILISYFSGPQVILISSLTCILAAILFDFSQMRVLSLLLLLCIILLLAFGNSLFKVTQTKKYSEKIFPPIFEKWSPLARITVYPQIFFRGEGDEPFGWGMSSVYKPTTRFKQLWIEQDASAGTPIVPFDGDYSKVDYLKYDITALPYYLKKNAKVFILGTGGGRDVLTALLFGNKDITGVDIHPIIVDLVKNRFAAFSGHIFNLNHVKIVVAEGRSFLENTKQHFDLIQIPLIDSWAATVSGAFAMTENSLYTLEAFVTYLQHLTANGILSLTRFYYIPDTQTIKVAILARVALERLGVSSPEKHIIAIRNTTKMGDHAVATILVKRSPFSSEELKQIKQIAKKLVFPILYLPNNQHNEPSFQTALTTKNLHQFLQQSYFDLRPNSDDRPFFFQMMYFSKITDLFKMRDITGQYINFFGVGVLFWLLILSGVFILLFYFAPLLLSQRKHTISLSWGVYFILLGLGFMLLEIPFIQQGAIYLGSPIYGLSVSLFSLLFFGGIGSIFSTRYQHRQLMKLLFVSLSVVAVMAFLFPLGFYLLREYTYEASWVIKCLAFVLLLCPTALAMGVALPSGLRLAQQKFASNIPWFWALNGAASVLGSIIAMALAIAYGYSVTLILGAIAYFLALMVISNDAQLNRSC